MGEFLNYAHVDVIAMFFYDWECWGSNIGVQRVANNLLFDVHLSLSPFPQHSSVVSVSTPEVLPS